MSENNLTIRHSIYKQRYIQVPAIALADKTLSLSAKIVLGIISDYCNYDGHGQVFPKQETLAEKLGCSRPTISKYLNELKEKGYLDWELTNSIPPKNYYYLDIPEVTGDRFNLEAWNLDANDINRMSNEVNDSTIVKQDLQLNVKQALAHECKTCFTQGDTLEANSDKELNGENASLTYTIDKPILNNINQDSFVILENDDTKLNFSSIRKRLNGEQLEIFDIIVGNKFILTKDEQYKPDLNIKTITGKLLVELIEQSTEAVKLAYDETVKRGKDNFKYFTKVFFSKLQELNTNAQVSDTDRELIRKYQPFIDNDELGKDRFNSLIKQDMQQLNLSKQELLQKLDKLFAVNQRL